MINSVLIVFHDGQHKIVLPTLEKILKSKKIEYSTVDRECLNDKSYDNKELVIVIGGDGTFLRANHLNKNVPMLGINPNPRNKEGFYMQADALNFEEKLDLVLENKFKIIYLLRLNAEINGQKLKQSCLNEIYIGDIKPYNVFNYELIIDGKREFQRGSGVIIGTPSGSSAWLKSSGGRLMKLDEQKFQYVSRELYEGKLTKKYILKQGIVEKEKIIELFCKSPGILVIDSISPEYELKIDDKIKLYVDKNPLNYIAFN